MRNSKVMFISRELVRQFDDFDELKEALQKSTKYTEEEKRALMAEIRVKWNHKMGNFGPDNNQLHREALLWNNTDLLD